MNNQLMFSSKSEKWDTPQSLIDDLATVFSWDLDVCASKPNVCKKFYNKEQNGLDLLYSSWNYCQRWCNPPYGHDIYKWYERAESNNNRGFTVMLVPARTDTKAWQKYIPYASHIIFIKGRLIFGSDEYWIKRRQEQLTEVYQVSEIDKRCKKIGIELCGDYTKSHVNLHGSIDTVCRWMNSKSNLKKDPAPFPSAFMVFGQINQQQRDKLFSYGWGVSQ